MTAVFAPPSRSVVVAAALALAAGALRAAGPDVFDAGCRSCAPTRSRTGAAEHRPCPPRRPRGMFWPARRTAWPATTGAPGPISSCPAAAARTSCAPCTNPPTARSGWPPREPACCAGRAAPGPPSIPSTTFRTCGSTPSRRSPPAGALDLRRHPLERSAALGRPRLEAWTRSDGLPADRIWDLLVVQGGAGPRLWLATEGGPAWLELDTGKVVMPPGGRPTRRAAWSRCPAPRASARSGWARTAAASSATAREPGTTSARRGTALGLRHRPGAAARQPGRALGRHRRGGSRALEGHALERVELGPKFPRARSIACSRQPPRGADAVWLGTRNNGLLR